MSTIREDDPRLELRSINTLGEIDRIVHDIQNNLQVIRMEAELKLIDPDSRQGHQPAFAAAQKIETLLTEVKKCFSFQ